MPDFFAHAASHRPIVRFIAGEDVAERIKALAESGIGGLCMSVNEDDDVLRFVEAACTANDISWWLSAETSRISAALLTQTLEVGAGGAAGAWARAEPQHEWVAARVVPMGERGLRWHQSLDLLSPEALLEQDKWNGAARLFLFRQGVQSSFWPDESSAVEVLTSLGRVADLLGKTRAWRGLWLDTCGANDADGEGTGPPLFPFSEGLAARFENITGRSFATSLPSLIADTGANAVADRLAFWEAAFADAEKVFWQPIRAACEERAVEFIVSHSADKVSALEIRWGEMLRRYAHGVAVLPLDIDERDNRLSVRQAASFSALDGLASPCVVSRLNGPALCTGAGRFRIPEAGPDQAAVNLYAANMGSLAVWGKSGARTALLWPTRSLRAHYNPRAHRFVRWVEEDLRRTAHYLEALHFDFLLLPGGDLETGRVEEARPGVATGNGLEGGSTFLRCGRAAHKFEMIVLPSVTTLARAAWDKLEAFAEAGGKVVCLGLLPRWSEHGRDEELEARISRTTMLTIADLYSAYSNFETGAEDDEVMSVGYPIARSNERGGRISCYQPKLNPDPIDAQLRVRQLLMDSLTPTVQSQSEELLAARRVLGEDELFLLHNQSESAARINVRLSARHEKVALLSTNGDALQPVREWMTLTELEGGGLSVPLEMAGGEIRGLLRRSDAGHDADALHVERANFVVENMTADSASGYAKASGIPAASWLKDEHFITRRAAPVRVPPPLLLEWDPQEDDQPLLLNAWVAVPDDWHDCRVWFEAVGTSPFKLRVNESNVGTCVAPPWKVEITAFIGAGGLCDINVEVDDGDDLLARLVAYPRVEIS